MVSTAGRCNASCRSIHPFNSASACDNSPHCKAVHRPLAFVCLPSSAGGGVAARSRISREASLVRADGVVWSRNFLATPPRPLHKRRLRCFFLMSRPPLLLLRRGAERNRLQHSHLSSTSSRPVGPHRLLAQQTINYATVSGRVADPTDAVVPGAEIVARQTEHKSHQFCDDRSGRAFSISLPQTWSVRDFGTGHQGSRKSLERSR